MRLRNQWQNLSTDEQRMLWLAAGEFGDDGAHARTQLRATLEGAWRLGFEANNAVSFAGTFQNWVQENG